MLPEALLFRSADSHDSCLQSEEGAG